MVSMNEIHLIKDVTPPPYAQFRYKPLALRLKGMRKELGFDLAAMAAYVGVAKQTYYKWENGERQAGPTAMYTFDLLDLIRKHAPQLHRTLVMTALEHGGYDEKL